MFQRLGTKTRQIEPGFFQRINLLRKIDFSRLDVLAGKKKCTDVYLYERASSFGSYFVRLVRAWG
jgi:hypothetical protein